MADVLQKGQEQREDFGLPFRTYVQWDVEAQQWESAGTEVPGLTGWAPNLENLLEHFREIAPTLLRNNVFNENKLNEAKNLGFELVPTRIAHCVIVLKPDGTYERRASQIIDVTASRLVPA